MRSARFWNGENDPCRTTQRHNNNMSDILVIAFLDVQKVENAGRKLLPMQNRVKLTSETP